MRDVREMVLRDVRCFEGVQRGILRPITLLVGENSTGKSTFLGCYSVLHRVLSEMDFVGRPDFNEEPFFLGSFRDIVRSRRGPSGRINRFQLGFVTTPVRRGSQVPCRLLATFAEQGSQPVVSSFRWQFDAESFLEARRGAEGETILRIPNHEVETEIPFMNAVFLFDVLGEGELLLRRWDTGTKPIVDYLEGLLDNQAESRRARSTRGLELWPHLPDLIPVAPLRSKPKRTYDPVRETASPDGEHIPMLMMRLDHTAKSHWDALHGNLVEFGRQSGLFSDIKVKRHGKQMSDPFQLQVKVRSGSHANIMDVGYGVSQSLPILVDVMAAEEPGRRSGSFRRGRGGRVFLLQQPEVHLHPRGQAELASLFVESFKRRGNHFLIETHSDYIIDRVRISVRKGILKPDEVSMIYFEPKGNAVKIHNMTLDKEGNLRGAPEEYREFFARETDQLLGFSE
ncbi:MAG: AAA family ATPase [Gammaproteobacteria bacterium]|nr:AAA family ATPase [Gammaproteobacteria bacterium]